MTITEIKERADGKFSCVLNFDVGPNGFGGRYPGKTFRKIVSAEKLADWQRVERESKANAEGQAQ